MSNWNCSLSAIQVPRGKASRKRFIPPPRKIMQVPWTTEAQMIEHIGFIPGNWKLSTNQQGHVNWSGEQGTRIAQDRGHMILWLGGNRAKVIHNTSFVGHHEDPEEKE